MSVVSSLLNGGVNVAGLVQSGRIANQNFELQKQNLEYQKDLQQQIFEREDNAVQRRAADLEAAGLSKTLAAGSAAGAGQAISTSAPQMSESQAKALQNFKTDLNVASEVMGLITQSAEMKQAKASADVASHNAKLITDSPFTSHDSSSLASLWRLMNSAGIDVNEFAQSLGGAINGLSHPFQELIESMSGLTDSFGSSFKDGMKYLGDSLSGLGNRVNESTLHAFDELGDSIVHLGDRLTGPVGDLARAISSIPEESSFTDDESRELAGALLDQVNGNLPGSRYLLGKFFKWISGYFNGFEK